MSERTPSHILRLEQAIKSLQPNAETEVSIRSIDAALPNDSVFWNSNDDGDFIEWGGFKPNDPNPKRYLVRLYHFPA